MRHKACFSGLPTSQELATHQLGLFTKPAAAGAGSFAQLKLRIYWHGGGSFCPWSSSVKCHFPSYVILCQRSSSVKGCLLSKFAFRQRSSSIKGRLSSKFVFRQRSSSVKGHHLSKVVFLQRSSFDKGLLTSKVVFQYTDSDCTVFS